MASDTPLGFLLRGEPVRLRPRALQPARRHRLARSRTLASHAGNAGSNPAVDTKRAPDSADSELPATNRFDEVRLLAGARSAHDAQRKSTGLRSQPVQVRVLPCARLGRLVARHGFHTSASGVRFPPQLPWNTKARWWAAGLENRGTRKGEAFDSSVFLPSLVRSQGRCLRGGPESGCYPGEPSGSGFDSPVFHRYARRVRLVRHRSHTAANAVRFRRRARHPIDHDLAELDGVVSLWRLIRAASEFDSRRLHRLRGKCVW